MTIEPDAIANNTYVAALAGAILGLKAVPGTTLVERTANLIFGFLIAVYLGPATIDYLSITSPKVSSGVIFALGSAGLVTFAGLVEGIKQTKFGDLLSSWFRRGGT